MISKSLRENHIIPIFILSLPRSGSTLLQRIIATHNLIETTSEPWLLLSLFYARRSQGVHAEYNHQTLFKAYKDFIYRLPQKDKDYEDAVRDFALSLYRKAAGKTATHFIDKTPRYSLICDQLMRTFPRGKFIFLWRNPLSIAASMMHTWGKKGRWNLHEYEVDLYKGLDNLTLAMSKRNNCYSIRYEDLVADPEKEIKQLFSHLDISVTECEISSFNQVTLAGRMGDPTGSYEYNRVTKAPVDKWKRSFSNPLRKRWARNYLNWIGQQRLNMMGYSLGDMLSKLDNIPVELKYSMSDIIRRTYWRASFRNKHNEYK